MKNPKKLYIETIILLFFCVVIFFVYTKEEKITTPSQVKTEAPLLDKEGVPAGNLKKNPLASGTPPQQGREETIPENTQSATVLAGEMNINLSFLPNTIFYDALIQARDANKITFSGKNYPGLGFFVTDIGTLHAGSRKYLIYYINGKEATVGVSAYTLKKGDVIEWKLE